VFKKKTFTLWINAHLSQRNLKVESLERDLCDGVYLINLLEIILKKKLVNKIHRSNLLVHKLDNLTIVIKTMENNGIKSYGFSADDIVNGKLKNILALTWALVCTYGVPDDIDKIKPAVSSMILESKPTKETSASKSSVTTTTTTPQTTTTVIPTSQVAVAPPASAQFPVTAAPLTPTSAARSTTDTSAVRSSISSKPVTSLPPVAPTPTYIESPKKVEEPSKPIFTPPTSVADFAPSAKVKPPEEPPADDDDAADEIEASSQNYPGERYRVASAETIGVRRTMEDFIRVIRNFRGKNDEDLFCVFDGHGSRRPAEYSGENLPKTLESYLEKHGDDTTKAMEETFIDVDKKMADWAKECGTTACVALVQGEKLTVANAGDTRAVLCRGGKAIRLSFDHKPKVPSEKERIEKLGGFVAMGRVNAVLAVSRALGDSQVDNLVTAEPYVTVTQLQAEDEFLIIACDGVWDILEDQNAVDLIRNLDDKDAVLAAEELRNSAFNGGSNDNISAIVIFFKL